MNPLVISICIPQYNRIRFLLKNLEVIRSQSYPHIEIIISDDHSSDDTELQIHKVKNEFPFPIHYTKNEKNLGYDANLRESLEYASGDYCFVLGNDDTLMHPDDITYLVSFLKSHDFPDVGFCNYQEETHLGHIYERASVDSIIGTGAEVALAHFGNFSFVSGLIFKRQVFLRYNTNRYDGSIYVQIYLACRMIASGGNLFGIHRTMVLKDLIIPHVQRGSYQDTIARQWKAIRIVDGGLPSVIRVTLAAFSDAGVLNQRLIYKTFFKIYSTTFPHWMLEYRGHRAYPEALGLMLGLAPYRLLDFTRLNLMNQLRILLLYIISSLAGLFVPVFIYRKFKPFLFSWVRRKTLR